MLRENYGILVAYTFFFSIWACRFGDRAIRFYASHLLMSGCGVTVTIPHARIKKA